MHKKEVFNLEKRYIVIIALLIFFGFYKNAWLLKVNGFGTSWACFKLIFFPLSSFLLGFIYDKITCHDNYFKTSIYLLLMGMTFPISTNLGLYLIFNLGYLGVLFLFKTKRLRFNLIAFFKVLSFLILNLFQTYNYANLLEQSQEFNYNFLDKIMGFTTSGIFTSSFLIILLGFILVLFDKYYKKEIAIMGLGSYLITLLLVALIRSDMLIFIREALNSLVWFGIVLIASLSIFSPVVKSIRYMYGWGIGFFTVIFSLFTNFYEGVFIAIMVMDGLRGVYHGVKLLKNRQKR